MFNNLPKRARIVEVGMRDGLQNEKEFIPTVLKVHLINLLAETGLEHLEITSFVSPRWIPQLADHAEVAAAIEKKANLIYAALVPNLKGLAAAQAAGLQEISFFMSASEGHSQRNINKSIQAALLVSRDVVQTARSAGIQVRAYLSTAFGCPFGATPDPKRVLEICQELIQQGVYQVSISDTIGVANPKQVAELVELLQTKLHLHQLAVHFHDTRGSGLANALAALQCGVTTFDSSFGGLGGCPYAPGAAGNIATEDLVFLLHNMGVETGINLDQLIKCSQYAQRLLQRKLPSKYLQSQLTTIPTN